MTIALESRPRAWQIAAEHSRVWRATASIRAVWIAAERRIERAAASHATADADRRAETAFRSSAIVRAVDSGLHRAATAWLQSATSPWLRVAGDAVFDRTAVARLRRAGLLIIIAAVTAVVLQQASPVPMFWILPAIFAVGGLITAICAAEFVRAFENR